MSAESFVGRQQELERLREAFDGACDGRGSLVMITGEPGIGKTRLAREFESYAVEHGARVLWGRAHEAGGAPAYWPWAQAIRQLAEAADDGELLGWLGDIGAEVARIVPALHGRLPDLPEPEPTTDPESARFRLFDATTTFLSNVASAGPLVVVLDDLHWADQSTLQLLEHTALELPRARLLLVGTYRDVELGRQHPLEEALAGIGRAERFRTVDLRGLSETDVAAYVRETTGVEPSVEAMSFIYGETEGNAFFVQEMVALMAQEGTLESGEVSVPASVRAAIGHRLNALTEECNDALRTAAVAGREFSEALLAQLVDRGAEQVPELLESALSAGLVDEAEQTGEYRFAHALIQETLLEELRASQRVRLHGRVARALEDLHGDRALDHAAELAHHFSESALLDAEYAGRALHYAKAAAEQAAAAYAWSEAARQYERCLSLVNESEDGLAEDEAAVLTALEVCYHNANLMREAWRSAMRALTIYRDRGDAEGFARTTLELTRVIPPAERILPLLQESLRMLDTRDPHLEARIHAELLRRIYRGHVDSAELAAHRARAEELARQHRYPDVEAAIAHGDVVSAELAGAHAEAARLGIEAHAHWDALGMWNQAADSGQRATKNALWAGRLGEGLDMAEHTLAYARRFHLRFWEESLAAQIAHVRVLRAEWDAASALLGEYGDSSRFRRSGAQVLSLLALADIAGAQRALPATDAAEEHVYDEAVVRAIRARVFLAAGDRAEAESEYRAMEAASAADPSAREADGWAYDDESTAMLGEAFVELADRPSLRAWFDAEQDRPVFIGSDCFLLTYAHVGLALGELDRAQRALEDALAIAKRERAPVIEGRCHQGLAKVAERRGHRGDALGHLEAATALLEQHGAKFYLDQARARLEELRAAPGARQRGPDGLTARELEVLRLIAGGKSSRAIAEELVLSIRTIERHIANIYVKTDTHSRAQATAYALRQGLA